MFETIVLSARQDLEDSLKTLYPTFFEYPFPSSLDASPLRDAEKILTGLKSAPLREIDAAVLGPYAAGAITTIGSVDDFRHSCRVFSTALSSARPHSVSSRPSSLPSFYCATGSNGR
ncbi:hypothetical protein GR197_17050 [Rhizobium phaseoli]|uniref:Uncharacterized protein n=1 Tax=Rhizobium phaseoli TaxID=396 RepID=A0A7K3UEX2_9HYPH|nr:hypothetical protein [Rhizobium phaseoli]NEJ72223.1 hypothetical protein [Rhizobium phaseoli]